MSFFERELQRIADVCKNITNPTFAGRACYGDLGGDNRVKLQFVTLGRSDHYEALKATVLNRTEGEVDSLLFRFEDIWGKKHNKGYNGGIPHIWTNDRKADWYAYTPTAADIKVLATEVSAYLHVFVDRSLVAEKSKGISAEKAGEKDSVVKEIRGAKKPATTRKPSQTRKKTDPDL